MAETLNLLKSLLQIPANETYFGEMQLHIQQALHPYGYQPLKVNGNPLRYKVEGAEPNGPTLRWLAHLPVPLLVHDGPAGLDPHINFEDSDLLYSRFLREVLGTAVLLTVMRRWNKEGYVPPHSVEVWFVFGDPPDDLVPKDGCDGCVAVGALPQPLDVDGIALVQPSLRLPSARVVARLQSFYPLLPTRHAVANAALPVSLLGLGVLHESDGVEVVHAELLQELVGMVSTFTL